MLKNDRILDWSGERQKAVTHERFIKKYTPFTHKFLMGVARATKVDRLDLVTLLAHEEIVHQPHCSGVCVKDGTDQKTVLGQTWDWPPRYAPFGDVVEYEIADGEHVMSYQFPGLWAATGLNKSGLSLIWTGVGYYPNVKPRDGVPTYAIISELLQKKSVDEAIEFLVNIPNAGSFAFLIADKNKIAVIEAAPGKLVVEQDANIYLRANHYDNPILKEFTHQNMPSDHESIRRREILELRFRAQAKKGKLNIAAIQRILGGSKKISNYSQANATIAMIAIDPAELELHLTRGGFPFEAPKIFRFSRQ